jgi:hypothetical protein
MILNFFTKCIGKPGCADVKAKKVVESPEEPVPALVPMVKLPVDKVPTPG